MCKSVTCLITCVVVAASLLSATIASGSDPNLVGWWRFDETSGTTATDSSGSGNHAILKGSPQWVSGRINGAVKLKGVNDYVELPISSLLGTLDEATLTIWVNWSGLGGPWSRIIDFGNGQITSQANFFYVCPGDGVAPSRLCADITHNGAQTHPFAAKTFPAGNWHHLAVVLGDKAAKMLRVYVDGVQVAASKSDWVLSELSPCTQNWLGRSQFPTDPYFNGSLDDFRIYSRMMSDVEIQQVVQGTDMVAPIETDPRTPISAPYTITQPGSYYLTSDIQTTLPDQNAITVGADNVTLDLNGFNLTGRGSGKGSGIFMNGRTNVEIRNGTVREFGGYGIIELSSTGGGTASGEGHRVLDVRVEHNGQSGIVLNGINNKVTDCTVYLNDFDGITVGGGSLVSDNISTNNGEGSPTGGAGIVLDGWCLALNNLVIDNRTYGIRVERDCSSVLDNLAGSNWYYGILIDGNGNLVRGNTARDNAPPPDHTEITYNIYVNGEGNAIDENLATSSRTTPTPAWTCRTSYGIFFQSVGNFYGGNRASGNAIANYSGTAGNLNGGLNLDLK